MGFLVHFRAISDSNLWPVNQVTLSFCHGIFYFKSECENRGKLWPRVLRANVDVTLTLLHIRTATRWIVIYLIPGDNSFESSLHYERWLELYLD